MGKGKKKKNREMESTLQFFMAKNKISVRSEKELEELTKKLNEMLESYPYPEKEKQVLLSGEKEIPEKDKD